MWIVANFAYSYMHVEIQLQYNVHFYIYNLLCTIEHCTHTVQNTISEPLSSGASPQLKENKAMGTWIFPHTEVFDLVPYAIVYRYIVSDFLQRRKYFVQCRKL